MTTETHMRREVLEIPQAVARLFEQSATEMERAGTALKAVDPRVLVTVARGSSDHAASFIKYAVELTTGVPVASLGPSIASIYQAPLKLAGAASLSISQSGKSPDIVAMAEAVRRSGAVAVALTNTAGSPLALAADPKLIVADEPTTALDVSIQAQIIALLKRVCREQGASVMLVTHDMGVIAETCDRVAVMYAGRVAEIGPVQEVIHRPGHPYTAGLMGSIPSMDEDRERLVQIDGAMPRLNAIPSGCAFHPRCPRAFDRCHQQRPELMQAPATSAACWLHAEAAVAVEGDVAQQGGAA